METCLQVYRGDRYIMMKFRESKWTLVWVKDIFGLLSSPWEKGWFYHSEVRQVGSFTIIIITT